MPLPQKRFRLNERERPGFGERACEHWASERQHLVESVCVWVSACCCRRRCRIINVADKFNHQMYNPEYNCTQILSGTAIAWCDWIENACTAIAYMSVSALCTTTMPDRKQRMNIHPLSWAASLLLKWRQKSIFGHGYGYVSLSANCWWAQHTKQARASWHTPMDIHPLFPIGLSTFTPFAHNVSFVKFAIHRIVKFSAQSTNVFTIQQCKRILFQLIFDCFRPTKCRLHYQALVNASRNPHVHAKHNAYVRYTMS